MSKYAVQTNDVKFFLEIRAWIVGSIRKGERIDGVHNSRRRSEVCRRQGLDQGNERQVIAGEDGYKHLFAKGTMPVAFSLHEAKTSPRGVMIASYKRAGEVQI